MSFTRNLQNFLKQNNHTRFESVLGCGSEWSNSIEDYQFLEQIGSGSFGQVFKAKIDGNKCAIKRICKAKSPNINKILSEVSIHIRLSHPHILQLFNVVEDRKNVYLIMEICHGGSLSQLISKEVNQRKSLPKSSSSYPLEPVLPYIVISSILRQACNALAYLHRNSIVHRDLNLNNILLVKPFNLSFHTQFDYANMNFLHIKLADFGLAIDCKLSNQIKLNSPLPTSAAMGTTICGTPGFISPEIWTQMRTVSYKSDIYSLGSILFACISGYTPNGDIVLSNFLPMTADLITSLLDENPDNRPELKDILNHIFVSGRINLNRLHPIEKTTKNIRMSIDRSGNVVLCFLKDQLTISVTVDGSQVSITHAKVPNKIQAISQKYSFYELPQNYWKRYGYLLRFVNLVKAKTVKITVHCGKWFKENNNNNIKEYISGCALKENGDFEITLYNQVLNENFKFVLNSNLSKNLDKYREKLEELQGKIREIETEFTEMSYEMKIDLFPISFGFNDKLYKLYEEQNDNRQDASKNELKVNSQVLRSIQIDGIGFATQFSNGSIKVNFNDGSDLCLNGESQIFYVEDNILKKFNKDDILPEAVLNKIARMPQVINHLRECNKTLD